MPERPNDSTDTPPNGARARTGEQAAHEAARLLLDVFVYAPIGFVKQANTLVPELIKDGRSTAASAKTIGAFVTPILKRQGEKVLREQLRGAKSASPSTASTTSAARPAPKAPEATPSTGAAHQPHSTSDAASAEPFDGFDRLGAAAVVARLEELTKAQRATVRRYETANRNRRTVLGRLDQLDAAGS